MQNPGTATIFFTSSAATSAHGRWSRGCSDPSSVAGAWMPYCPPCASSTPKAPSSRKIHYCIPPLERIDHAEVLELIRRKRYFVLHAPRQTGKTSALLALRDLLEAGGEGDYRCVYVNVEAAQAVREDVERAMRVILGEMGDSALFQGDGFLDGIWSDVLARFGDRALGAALARWSQADPKPLVLLIDEIDSLIGDTPDRGAAPAPGRLRPAPRGLPAERGAVRGARRARLPHPLEHREGGRHRRQRVQHPGRVAAPGGLHRGGGARPGRPAHRRDGDRRSPPEALETVWAQTLGQPWLVNALCAPRVLRGQDGAGPLAGHHRGGGDGRTRASRAEPSGPSRPARRQAPGGAGAPRGRAAAERGRRGRRPRHPRHRVRARPGAHRPRRTRCASPTPSTRRWCLGS